MPSLAASRDVGVNVFDIRTEWQRVNAPVCLSWETKEGRKKREGRVKKGDEMEARGKERRRKGKRDRE